MISGDNRPDLVAGGLGAGTVGDAGHGRDDEGVGSQDEIDGKAALRRRVGLRQKTAPSHAFELECFVRIERQNRVAWVGARHERQRLAVFDLARK